MGSNPVTPTCGKKLFQLFIGTTFFVRSRVCMFQLPVSAMSRYFKKVSVSTFVKTKVLTENSKVLIEISVSRTVKTVCGEKSYGCGYA